MENAGEEYDVIIIGAGVMGSSTAYQLSKRGLKTLLLEQFDFLHHRGSSHGESRTLRSTYPEDYYYNMVTESAKLWDAVQTEIGYKVYFKSTHFDMGPVDNKILSSIITNCQKHVMQHEILNHKQVTEKFSGKVSIPENWIGVHTDLGGVIKPTKAVSMFQTLATKNGTTLTDNTEVENIVKLEGGGLIISTTSGKNYRSKKCVITAGAWLKKLVKTVINIDLPIQPLETSITYWKIKEGHEGAFTIGDEFPTFSSCDGELYVYGTPSLEFPGLIKIAVHGGNPCDPDKRAWARGVKLSALREWIGKVFGGLVDCEGPVLAQSCMYSMTSDEDFVIDYLGGEFGKDVVVGGGFSGHGFKMAPVIGRVLADLVVGEEVKGVELKYFRIARFAGNSKGNFKEFED